MVEVPEGGSIKEALEHWYTLKKRLKTLQAEESMLRDSIKERAFPELQEGSNKLDLGDGFYLEGNLSYTYKVDRAALATKEATLRDDYEIPMDRVIDYEPKMSKRYFKTLSDEQKQAMSDVFSIRPNKVQMDVKPWPKKD